MIERLQRLWGTITELRKTEAELDQKSEDLARSRRFIAALNEVTAQIESTRAPDQILSTLGDELRALDLLCAVVLQDAGDDELTVRYTSMESAALALSEKLAGIKLEGYRIPRGTWFVSEIVESRKALYAQNPLEITAELVPRVPVSIIKRAARLVGLAPGMPAIYLPLTVEDRVVGALAVWGPNLRQEDVAALSVFAGQVASSLENARLFQAERRRAMELSTVLEVIKAVSSTLDLEEALALIAKRIAEAMEVDGCTLSRWDREADALVTWIEWRRDLDKADEPGTAYALADFPATRSVLETRQPLVVSVLDRDADAAELACMRQQGIKSLLMLPLATGEHVLGLLELDECKRDRDFSEIEIRLCQALADQAAVAIENSRLYESVRQELAERMRAEDALKAAHEELERRVEERTADLREANLALRGEIDERKRAEEALRESEARYRQLVKHAPTGLYEIDLTNMKLLAVNDVMCQYTGYSREEFLALNPLDIMTEGSLRLFLERQAKLHAGELVPEDVEYQIRTKDGRELWVLLNARYSQQEGSIRAAVVIHDITDRKRAELALRESEERYRNLFRHSNDGILLHDLEDNILDANRKVLGQFEYTRPEILSFRITDLLVPESLDSYRQALERITQDGVIRFEIPCKKKSGQIFLGEISSSLFELRGQWVVQGIVRDITERKRSEQLLQALNRASLAMEKVLTSEAIFAAVAEEFRKLGLACAVLLADEDHSTLSVRYLTYEAHLLKVAEELTGVSYQDFSFPIEDSNMYRRVVWDGETILVEGDAVMQHLMTKLAREHLGNLVEMLGITRVVAAPLIIENRVTGVLTVNSAELMESDIPAITAFAHQVAAAWRKAQLIQDLEDSLTELKRTQAQLVQAQKMEAIGRLAGGVAHDFNNLLTVIQVSNQLLMRELHPQDPLCERAQQIGEAGERASRLTRQLLSFSRREIAEPQVTNLSQVVSNLSRMLQRVIGEDIRLDTTLAGDLWSVKVDPLQMEQVIVNLAVNARDAMPQGGHLSLETANVKLDQASAAHLVNAQPGEYVMLIVSDTGMGMDDKVKAHVFEPFFTTKERGQGTGLGLSTVYGIVRQNRGHIQIDSELGHGATFRIYLPRTEEVQVSRRALPEDLLPICVHGSETILVVEDEEQVRKLAKQILESHGYQVLVAASGSEALRKSGRHEGSIHLLLTDVVMPGMNGEELAERLLVERPDTRVLFMSGYSHDVIAHHRVWDEEIDFLPKPFSLEGLTHKVRAVLDDEL